MYGFIVNVYNAQTGARQPAVILFGHGSRQAKAVEEFAHVCDCVQRCLPKRVVKHCFLEFAAPTFDSVFVGLYEQGVRNFTIVPMMLFAAGHAKNDIPCEIRAMKEAYAEAQVQTASDFGIQPLLLNAAVERINKAEASAASHSGGDYDRHKALLMVVGRGTSDPDANSDVYKLGRMIQESMKFPCFDVCYTGVTYPGVEEGLARAARAGFEHVVVFPYFLFTGVLVDRVNKCVEQQRSQSPFVNWIKAGYLNDHPNVIEQVVRQVQQAEDGLGHMNCSLCVYRERVIGFEHAHGQVQQGHHHHVRAEGVNGHSHHHHHAHDPSHV